MRYQPAHAATAGRSSSVLRAPRPLRLALSLVAAAAIGLVPGMFVASPAHAVGNGDVTIDSDLEQNEGEAFTFDVRRDGTGLSALTVDYAIVDGGIGTATTAGVDYTAISGSTTFPADRNVLKRFTVNGISDALDEDDETFTLKFMDPANHAVVIAFAYGTLDDDDATPSYTLALTNPAANPVAEAGGNATITATLSAVAGRAVTIPFHTVDASAVAPADYADTAGNIVIPAGDPSKSVNVPIVSDAFDEPDIESFTVASGPGNHLEALTGGDPTVQIADDDSPPTVSIAGAGNVMEGSPLTFVASLSAASKKSITVRATTTADTATAGDDYTALSEQPVTFDPGDLTKNIVVTTLPDTVNEVDPETLSMTISDPSNATAGTPMTATGGINDNDLPPGLTLDPVTVTEGDSGTAVPVTFNVRLTAPSGRQLTVGYQVNSGTATSGTDFTPVTSGTLTFPKNSQLQTFTVGVVGDRTHEGDEGFSIVLNDINTALAAGGALNPTTVTITDDDGVPTLQPMLNVTQSEGSASSTATFRAEISNPTFQDITLDVSAQDNTAKVDGSGPGRDDFDAPAATVTIPAGQTGADIPVTVNGDAVYEADETATITVAAQAMATAVTGGPEAATLRLNNDDTVPTVSLNSVSAAEGGSVPITATVTGQAQADIPITVAATGDSISGSVPATNADFNAAGLTTTSIPAGAASVPLGSIVFANDTIDEPDQTVKITLTGSPLTSVSTFETITDDGNDIPPVIGIGGATVTESAGPVDVPVTLVFGANGNATTSTEQTVVVHYATGDGTAKAPGDYTAAAEISTLTFVPGETTKNISVPIQGDGVYEATESFTVTLSSPSPAGLPINPAAATVTITDDDSGAKPTFSVTGPPSVAETAGTAAFSVHLSQANTQDVDFTVAAADVTAKKAGSGPGSHDYTAPATTVTVLAGETSAPIPVTINDDSVYESTETATIAVDLAAGETDASGSVAQATLTITDDDTKPTVALTAGSAAEGASVPVTATVTGVAQDAMPITLTVAGALNGENSVPATNPDFDASGLTATAIPAGDQTGAAVPLGSIAFVSDRIDEPVQTVKVTMTSSVLATATAFAAITDDPNDQPPSASAGDVPVGEGDEVAAVPVTLAFDESQDATSTERDIVVDYQTVDGTAKVPGDYTAPVSGASLTFLAGTLSHTVNVPIIDDSIYERAETFSVRLTAISPSGATIADDTGVVTIAQSDDDAKPTFSVEDVGVREDVAAHTADFTVRLVDTSTENVTFSVSMTNGTAVEGGTNPGANDFDDPTATLTILAGATTGTISVPINNDSVFEDDETATLRVALAAGQTGATGDPDLSTLTIRNDDAAPTIALNTATGGEGSSVDVVATVSGVAQAPMVFDLTLAGDATDGIDPAESSDYTAGATMGTIPAGTASDTPITLTTIALNGDSIDENAEFIAVDVSDRAEHVTGESTTYTITDDANDKPPSISIGDVTVAEGVGSASVPVTLAFGSGNAATSTERDTVVSYMTVDGSATAGSDYTGTATGTVVVPKNVTTGALTVPISNDIIYERDETFTVRTTSHTPAEAVVARNIGTVTVSLNDTDARQSFTVTSPSRLENASGPADFVVSLGGATTQPVSFAASMTPGTATTGGTAPGSNDYTFAGSSTTYTIPAGETSVTIPVTVNGDTVFEGDEAATLTVALAAGEDNAVGDPQTGTLTIHNDDAAPTLTLNTGESGTEGTEMAVIAKANGVSQAAMTFTVTFSGDSTNGNTAASADDYVDSSIQGIIPAGTAASTPITWGTFRLANDHIDEPAETIKALAHDVGNHVDDVSAFYKINDDANDRPPSVSVSDVTVDEGAGDADVAVNLGWDAGNDATSTTRPVVVDYMTVNGTAVAPSDYGAVTSDSITIAAGEASGTISVPIADDNRNEPDETFGVKITSASPTDSAIARGTGTVTITDNDQDAERPTFAVENIAKAEDAAGTADFTVTLSGVAADDVDFNVYMSDGTAVDTGSGAGSNDYNAPIAALTIPVGQTAGTVSVTVNPDTVYEGDENATLHVALTDTERDATGVPKTPTLTITDDDPVPAIALNTASGSEGDDVSVIATVTGITQRDVTYDLGYSGDTTGSNNAAEPADYDASEVTAVVPGGTATGAKVNFGAIKLAADHVDEPVEVIKVAQRTTGNAVGASTIYKINDDLLDLPPTISIGDAEVGEGDGNAEVPVSLAFGAPGNDATSAERDTVVSYSTANGTATAGLDYTVMTDSVTIGAGQLSGVIRVPVINDTRDEPAETFTVRTTAHTPTEATVGRGTGTVTITDNDADAPRPSFSVEDVSKVENSAGTAEFTVELSGVAQGDVDFNVYMSDGSAVDTGSGVGSNDYNAPLAALTIPTGQTVGTVSVTVNGDAVYEGAESAALHVALADGERDASGIPMTPSLTITDDDPVPTIALNTASGGEGDDVSVIATVTGVTQRDVTYDLEYSGDTTGSNNAAEPADYDSSEVTAVIPGGTATGAKVNFGSIKLGADHVDEPVEVIRVAQHTTGDTVGVSTIYKINDDVNDLPPSVSIGDLSVGEGDERADVPVDLVWADGNDAIATERDTVVSYATANGTAVAPADYTASTTGSVTIAAVDESGTISVPIVDDTRDENAEAFTVRVTSHTPTEATVSRSTGTVTITDNDAEAPRPSFSVDDVSKVENSAGTANFTVELSGVAQGDVSFTVGMGATEDTAVDVGAGAGSNDYNPPLTAFTIPEGQTTVTVPVTVNGDAIYEADETATLTVALADGERDAAGDPVNPTLTIENDDTKPTMTLKTAFGYEGVDLSVSAIVAGTAQDDVSYDLSFAGDGSGTNNAAEDDDFDASGVAAVIPAGTASGAQVNLGSISLADDTVDEPTETIRAVAHDPDADSTAGDRTSSYRIFDDPDDLPPSVAIGDVTVGEGDETAEVPVSLTFGGDTTATEQDVTVAFTMSNGTARTGLDYTGRSGSLRIAAGETEGAVSVAITDDSLFEDDQDFTVKLGSATPNGVVVDSAVGTVTIAENDEATAPTLTAPTTIEGMGYVIMTGRAGEGATVQLLMAPGSSGGSFTAAATTVADSSGNFSFRRYFDIGYRVQARAHDLTSPPRAVAVRQLPTLTGGSTVRGAVTLTVTGNPRSAGQVVQFQRANTGGTWTTVATGALTSAGTFSANVRGLTSGAFYTFRAVIPATPAKGILAGTSATRRIGVR